MSPKHSQLPIADQPLIVGLMGGSSLDAVDAAIVAFDNPAQPKILGTYQEPMPAAIRKRCLNITQSGFSDIDILAELDVAIGELCAKAVLQVLAENNFLPEHILAVGSHGQTLRHHPSGSYPFTLQIGDPNIIAERTQIMTVADFRRRDVAAGGQGAPLAPGFHQAVFSHLSEPRVVLNIGGIGNMSYLPSRSSHQPVLGFDTGPGNCLMDAWTEKNWQQPFDKDGKIAAAAHPEMQLIEVWLKDAYFQQPPPKSSGRDYFNLGWLEKLTENSGLSLGNFSAANILASLNAFTAVSIAREIQALHSKAAVFVCGGGARNPQLMLNLATELKRPVHQTEALGIADQWVEAMLVAWMAYKTLCGQTSSLASVTGAKAARVLGGIYGFNPAILHRFKPQNYPSASEKEEPQPQVL